MIVDVPKILDYNIGHKKSKVIFNITIYTIKIALCTF